MGECFFLLSNLIPFKKVVKSFDRLLSGFMYLLGRWVFKCLYVSATSPFLLPLLSPLPSLQLQILLMGPTSNEAFLDTSPPPLDQLSGFLFHCWLVTK